VSTEYVPPQTTVGITNFGGVACGGTLVPILETSCNTAFAEMAAETLGPEIMIDGAERFGFNDRPPIDMPAPAESVFPTDFEQNLPALAQSGIGQNDVQATPLQMALVAAAAANGGEIMAPTVMQEIRDSDGGVIEWADERVWRRAAAPEDAETLRNAMIDVVDRGTAVRMQIPGMVVGGKTGTAQIGRDVQETHAWVIGFAGSPGKVPRVAIAVFVKAVPGQGQQAGGQVAAPIGKAVLEAALAATTDDPGEPAGPGSSSTTRPPTSQVTTPPATGSPSTDPATVPPATVPPATAPPTTAAPETVPPATEPPATAPPATEGPAPPTTGP
jgi:peptidoglycan glycosyltransferase